MNWANVLPPFVATQQTRWERRRTVARMHSLGFTQAQIARWIKLSPARIAVILHRTEREKKHLTRSPVEIYLDETVDVRGLCDLARDIARRERQGEIGDLRIEVLTLERDVLQRKVDSLERQLALISSSGLAKSKK